MIVWLGLVVLACVAFLSGPAVAQTPGKTWRIGVLNPSSRNAENVGPIVEDGFLRGMRDLGYVEGKNLQIEWRFADGKPERLPALATELVQQKVALIVAGLTQAVRAAQRATSSIPIVMVAVPSPVASGLVASLRRPGGNITGISGITTEISGKYVELLRDAIPNLNRIAVFLNGASPAGANAHLKQIETAAKAAGVRIIPVRLMKVEEIAQAVQTAVRERVGAIVVTPDPLLASGAPQINNLALKARMPTVYGACIAVEQGGLMCYDPNFVEQWRRAATYVDKILKGAKPGELPVEQPTTFELVINMKTAKALGLNLPQQLLFRADRVIE